MAPARLVNVPTLSSALGTMRRLREKAILSERALQDRHPIFHRDQFVTLEGRVDATFVDQRDRLQNFFLCARFTFQRARRSFSTEIGAYHLEEKIDSAQRNGDRIRHHATLMKETRLSWDAETLI